MKNKKASPDIGAGFFIALSKGGVSGAAERNRTSDLLITNHNYDTLRSVDSYSNKTTISILFSKLQILHRVSRLILVDVRSMIPLTKCLHEHPCKYSGVEYATQKTNSR